MKIFRKHIILQSIIQLYHLIMKQIIVSETVEYKKSCYLQKSEPGLKAQSRKWDLQPFTLGTKTVMTTVMSSIKAAQLHIKHNVSVCS